MMYEVSAAAKPPQTTPLFIGIRVDTRVEEHLYTVKMGQPTQETGKRPNGAASEMLAVTPRVSTRMQKRRGVVCGGFAATDTSYVIVRASFARISHSIQTFPFYWRPKSSAHSALSISHFRQGGTNADGNFRKVFSEFWAISKFRNVPGILGNFQRFWAISREFWRFGWIWAGSERFWRFWAVLAVRA